MRVIISHDNLVRQIKILALKKSRLANPTDVQYSVVLEY